MVVDRLAGAAEAARQVGLGDGNLFLPNGLAQRNAAPRADYGAVAQVGQGEGRLAIAAVGRADDREQGFILIDRQNLAGAQHIAFCGKISRHLDDHADILQRAAVEHAFDLDAVIERQFRLHVADG